MIAWDDFRLVQAVAETRSLVAAADSLAVNHSTVFRRLGALERQLGTRLFERSRNGYAPTPTGEEMVRLAERMSEEIAAVERRITGQDLRPSGELRITTNDTLLVHLMTPVLASFRRSFPEIQLDVVVSNQSLNLTKRDADVALRASDRPGDTLVGRRLATIAWGIYGRSDAVGTNAFDPARMRHHEWVGFSDALAGIRPAKWLREQAGEERIGYRVNTVLGLAEAAAAGIGFAVLPCFIGSITPGLTRLSDPLPELDSGLWMLTHPDLRTTARVRAFMDHAGQEISRRRGQIEGREEAPSETALPPPAEPGETSRSSPER